MIITDAGEFLRYFERVRERTDRVVGCIPVESVEWSPRENAYTLGDLVRHIGATERFMWAENVLGRPSRYPGCGTDLADGLAEVRAFLAAMHDESVAIFGSLSSADLERRCPTPGGVMLPTWKWLRAMVEHEIHHRGQLYTMLGILGVPTPPLYGLTEREVYANSLPGEET